MRLSLLSLACVGLFAAFSIEGWCENIDPYDEGAQFAWSENTGWLNAETTFYGMHVLSDKVFGYLWGENIGWINLHCENNNTCASVAYGVVNDGAGHLSGLAWGENVGWINFDPDVPSDTANQYRVTIDAAGYFSGWAWGENIGWIHFDQTQGWNVQVCIVNLEDLVNFASYWLQVGSVPGNFTTRGTSPDVDMNDYTIFASYWQSYCPQGWQLKY